MLQDPTRNTEFHTKVAADNALAYMCGQALCKYYPGHGWEVNVNHAQGVIDIWNKRISRKWGWRQKMSEVEIRDIPMHMVKIGGELLERAHLKRGKLDVAQILGAARKLSGDIKVEE